jgi:hypothetical protein
MTAQIKSDWPAAVADIVENVVWLALIVFVMLFVGQCNGCVDVLGALKCECAETEKVTYD